MRKLPALIVIALATGLSACRDQAPEIPKFDGSWAGFIDVGLNIQMLVTEDRRIINGAGKFTGGPQPPIAFTITGVHEHPDVVLNIRAAGFADVNFAGRFQNDDRVAGRLDGAGFTNNALTLGRQ